MAAPADVANEGKIIVSGHQVEVGEALRAHATEQASRLSAKYFDGAEDITVTFSPGGKGAGFGCNIRVHAARGLFFDGHGEHAGNAYTAFSTALERVAKQLRRQKRAMREDKPVNATKEGLL
ncbi:HPF/RaiA family ribosome-associated protein [Pararoseomonas indoligenes]|uniref:HPF/RaiA family ribosome-associated protein n=1 Tax=Roseomonas indoligenes TaxID=2820811 RepID=A0A940N0I5_9PROT|nr:HPF/RaiA family ribosome-associated protein [Pararoseomonas indoligenes]MBP0493846.1 HPF/RaiA family ribosome-associated protein [Pararoseomonas indoligenes]